MALRIAFLDSWPEARHQGSGTAVGIANLAQGLAARGHDVLRLSPEGTRNPDRPFPLLLQRIGFNRTVGRRIRASGPLDLVVGFDLDGFLWAQRRRRETPSPGAACPPFVLWLKGVAADEARFARGTEALFLSLVARLEAMNARAADRVLVPSRYSAGVARAAYGLAPRVLRVVPEAIDLDAWTDPSPEGRRPARSPTSDAPLRILSVARQYRRKDTATLLRSIPILRILGVPVRVRIVGGGPELPHLRRLARTLDLDPEVAFLGAVGDEADIREEYRNADLFCLPSLQEGFGIVFLEAMASGLPVVAARAGAAPEVVPEGIAGRLVPPGDPEALARALEELAWNPALRDRMGAAGRDRVRRFSLDRLTDRFLQAALGNGLEASLPTRAAPGTLP